MPGLVFSESVFLKLNKGDFFSPLTNCISYPFLFSNQNEKVNKSLGLFVSKAKAKRSAFSG